MTRAATWLLHLLRWLREKPAALWLLHLLCIAANLGLLWLAGELWLGRLAFADEFLKLASLAVLGTSMVIYVRAWGVR